MHITPVKRKHAHLDLAENKILNTNGKWFLNHTPKARADGGMFEKHDSGKNIDNSYSIDNLSFKAKADHLTSW